MTESYRGIPENQKITRTVPEGRQNFRQQPEASGRDHSRQHAEGAQTAYTRQTRTHSELPTLEEMRQFNEMRRQERPSRRGTLEEIRELLRDEARMREIEENAAMRKRIVDDLDRHREKMQQQTQEGSGKVTAGQLVLSLLAAILSLPVAAAEQSFEETKHQAEQAA